MPQFLSPICNDQTLDANGDPLTGGQIETYIALSTTPAATFTSSTGAVAQSNPIILDSLGYPPSPIWLSGGVAYKFVIKNALGVTLKTIDGISGVNDASIAVSEWVSSGFVPTYIGTTSFSVPGDQRSILQVGRRIRTTNTGGIIYSGISVSSFGAGVTTVTVVNDSGTLDSGLSLVEYGLISADNTSFPFATFSAASTIALTDDGTTNAAHYLTFADGTAGQENLKTDTAKLAYNPSTGALSATSFVGSGASLTGIGGRVAQVQRSFSGAVATGTTATPWDDSAPQITEGDQYYTVTITPQNAASLLEIDVVMNVSCASPAQMTVALHQDAIADALAAATAWNSAGAQLVMGVIKHYVVAGSTTARTYRVRVGNNAASTVTVNGSSGARRYGGVLLSGISVKEILP